MSAFAPHRLGASVPVSQEIALKFLTKYLEAAKTSPHLLPNARLDPSGPTAGSSSSSVTIHNLQRVEAGLRGEWLAPTLELEENVPVAEGMDDGVNQGLGAQQGNEAEGWMDLDDYQREQSIDGVDLEDRAQTAMNGEDSDLEDEHRVVNEIDGGDAPTVKTPEKTKGAEKSKKPLDKAARKEEKRRRKKEEQRLKEQERQRKAA